MGSLIPPPNNVDPIGEDQHFVSVWQRWLLSLFQAINTLGGTSGGAASPSVKVGPVVNNGSAVTFMRSDAAPAIDLTLNYAWTGTHTYNDLLLHRSTVSMTDGAAGNVGSLNNAPVAGNPTKWIPINDNGTTRYIPAW